MRARHWERLQRLFHAAADLEPTERRGFLAALADDDETLASELGAMLEEDARGESMLDVGLPSAARDLLASGLPPDGSFGPYRVTGLLGEGGMGTVYKAERADLGTTAAIKLLRDAWLSSSRRARFVEEQRTLARLKHPSIAALYDANTLADGTPWFVMEYVEGLPLTEYCYEHGAGLRERLQLFREVCEAVQFAHEQLIVHRDLKPSNILVTTAGRVKLLDFGIARPIDTGGNAAARTGTVLRLMTPAYASPQQRRGEPPGIDSDVYSLGVILYELLTGALPFDLSGRTAAEAEQLLDRAPERPSLAVSGARGAAIHRGVSAGRGEWADLDVLCLTAMHRDRARRYRTVQALLRDLDHFTAGEPLEAQPDSLGYRTGKFVRRNRAPLSVGAATVGTIAGLVTFYTWRLTHARDAALREAARAQRIERFMRSLFEGGDSEAGPADDLRVSALLDRGMREAETLVTEPATQAGLYHTLGHIASTMGRFDDADRLLHAALARRTEIAGADAPETIATLVAMVGLRTDQAQYEEAERLSRDALARAARLPPDHPLLAEATTALGRVFQEKGAYDAAIPVLQDAVALHERRGVSVELANGLHELANVHFYAGQYDESATLNERALAVYRHLFGDRHPHVGDTLINLGAIEFERGDYLAAERLYRDGLAITERWYGPDHHKTAGNLTMLGRTLARTDKRTEAAAVLQRALAGRERALGPHHPGVASVLNELGTIARFDQRFDEAEACYQRMADIYREVYKEGPHYLIGVALSNLGSVQHDRGQPDAAAERIREALAIFVATLPPGHVNIGIARVKLGMALLAGGDIDAAERETQAGYDTLRATMKPDAPWLATALTTLAQITTRRGAAPAPDAAV